jgi:hypothetical protein
MKKTLLFLCLSFCLVAANAQSTAYFKVANTGTLMKIEKVTTGGYITLGTDSNYKLQVIRWDNNFNPVWKNKFTDANLVAGGLGMVEANDGNFFIMAISYAHTGCAWITKLSSNGAVTWQKEYYVTGGNLNSFALSKASGSDNGFVFGGGQCVLNNYLIKCDADGNIEWQQQYYYPLASGVITAWSILPEGNNYVVSSGYNANSLLTFRIDSVGAVLSHTAYTYSSMQIIPTRMVKLNSTNGYAILGNYNNSNNNQTEFLAILNSSLTLTSFNELTISGYTQFELFDITAINNGQNLILDGSIYNNSTFYIAMMNVSNTGTIAWKTLASGNSGMPILNVEFRGVTSLGNSTVHVGYGYYEGAVVSIIDSAGNGLCNTLPFNVTNVPRTLALQSSSLIPISSNAVAAAVNYTYSTSVSSTQYFYCGSLPTSVEEMENNVVQIYPNPATNAFTIYDVPFTISEIEMYNMLGEKCFSEPVTGNPKQVTISATNFSPGVYFIRLAGDEKFEVKKVVIQR